MVSCYAGLLMKLCVSCCIVGWKNFHLCGDEIRNISPVLGMENRASNFLFLVLTFIIIQFGMFGILNTYFARHHYIVDSWLQYNSGSNVIKNKYREKHRPKRSHLFNDTDCNSVRNASRDKMGVISFTLKVGVGGNHLHLSSPPS